MCKLHVRYVLCSLALSPHPQRFFAFRSAHLSCMGATLRTYACIPLWPKCILNHTLALWNAPEKPKTRADTFTGAHTHAHTRTYTYAHAQACTHTGARAHTHTHVHTHTHTHAHFGFCSGPELRHECHERQPDVLRIPCGARLGLQRLLDQSRCVPAVCNVQERLRPFNSG